MYSETPNASVFDHFRLFSANLIYLCDKIIEWNTLFLTHSTNWILNLVEFEICESEHECTELQPQSEVCHSKVMKVSLRAVPHTHTLSLA